MVVFGVMNVLEVIVRSLVSSSICLSSKVPLSLAEVVWGPVLLRGNGRDGLGRISSKPLNRTVEVLSCLLRGVLVSMITDGVGEELRVVEASKFSRSVSKRPACAAGRRFSTSCDLVASSTEGGTVLEGELDADWVDDTSCAQEEISGLEGFERVLKFEKEVSPIWVRTKSFMMPDAIATTRWEPQISDKSRAHDRDGLSFRRADALCQRVYLNAR